MLGEEPKIVALKIIWITISISDTKLITSEHPYSTWKNFHQLQTRLDYTYYVPISKHIFGITHPLRIQLN